MISNQKTIAFVTPYFPPQGGGLEKYAYEIALRLHRDHGCRIIFITSGAHKDADRVDEVAGMKIYRLSYQWKVSNTPIALNWRKKIKTIFGKEHVDLVNVHTPVPGIGNFAAAVAGTRPVVVTYHAGSMRKHKFLVDMIVSVYENVFLPLLLKRANSIICSSDFVRNHFLKKYTYKSITVTPAVDVNLFKPSPEPPHDSTLLFVAGLGYAQQHKGLRILLDAVKKLEQVFPHLKLIVVGDGDMREWYESYVAHLGFRDRVSFRGILTGDELVRSYQSASVLVLPSYAPAESFGMVLIEAMACKLAVIGTNIGGIPTVISDHVDGLLIPPNDSKALADAIELIFSDMKNLRLMGENGRKKVLEHYTWDKKVAETFKIFNDYLNEEK
ncbi:MAG TPA: glycosyltransferase family 4 protein [Candidatus Paceibacterota bacterium]|nr:glycosyltransferase family 4 protein [Candidatus Paceibacterota bacterium]